MGKITPITAEVLRNGSAEPPLKLLLTVKEAADALCLDRSTVYELIMRGTLRSLKIGRSRRIRVKDLEQWVDEQLAA